MESMNLTIKEAVRTSKIGRNSILAAIHAKELEAFRIGKRKLLVPRKSLEAFIERKIAEGVVA